MNRREFLRRASLMGMGIISGGGRPFSELLPLTRRPSHTSLTRRLLGTSFHITVVHPSNETAGIAIELAFKEVERLSTVLSRHQENGPVQILNLRGYLENAAPELLDLVKLSIDWHRKTGGVFDITVEPIVNLFVDYFEDHRTPPPEEKLLELMDKVGTDKILLREEIVSFKREGMGITLDGIAKGYIVDRAMAILQHNGIKQALINAGGDIRMIGGKEGGKPWRIAVQDPSGSDGSIGAIEMMQGAVATSGNYQIYFDREKIYHHIVDPASGHSPRMNASTTIISRRTLEADILSTALFVMEPERGREYVERLSGFEGFIVTESGRRIATRGWKFVV